MIIEIKHQPVLKEERKKKLLSLGESNIKSEYVSYFWGCKSLDKGEDIYDLQLFCLSMTKNLLEQKFFTNEIGSVHNSILDNMDLKETIENVKTLMFDILEQKNTHQ